MILLYVALALAAAVAAAFARSRVPRVRGLRRVPQPFELPWLGNTVAALKDSAGLRERLHAVYGPVVAVTAFNKRYVQVRGFADVRRILLAEHDLVETEWPQAIRLLLGPGSVSGRRRAGRGEGARSRASATTRLTLFSPTAPFFQVSTTHFDAHRKLRTTLAPVFSPRAVSASVPAIAAILCKHMDRWADAGKPVGGAAAIKAATFEVMVDVGAGFPSSWATPEALARFGDLFEVWLAGFAPGDGAALARGLEARAELIKEITAVVEPAVTARRALADHGAGAGDHGAGAGCRPPAASMLDRLADAVDDAGRELPVGTLATIVLNLLFGGHETSSQIWSLLMVTLHRHPDLLAALREEQAQVMAEHGPTLTQAALDAAPLAAATVKEQLRFTPVVPQVFRRTLKPVALADATIGVPPGETLVLDLEHTMRNDVRWADEPATSPLHASKFNPRRWLDGGLAARKEGAFLPFGGGARYCVGWQLATAELATAVALLARGYAWRLANPDAPLAAFPKPRLPVDGLVMTVKRYDGQAVGGEE